MDAAAARAVVAAERAVVAGGVERAGVAGADVAGMIGAAVDGCLAERTSRLIVREATTHMNHSAYMMERQMRWN